MAKQNGFKVIYYESVISEIPVISNYLNYTNPYHGESKFNDSVLGLIDEKKLQRIEGLQNANYFTKSLGQSLYKFLVIPIEIQKRELLPACNILIEAINKGCSVIIGQKQEIFPFIEKLPSSTWYLKSIVPGEISLLEN